MEAPVFESVGIGTDQLKQVKQLWLDLQDMSKTGQPPKWFSADRVISQDEMNAARTRLEEIRKQLDQLFVARPVGRKMWDDLNKQIDEALKKSAGVLTPEIQKLQDQRDLFRVTPEGKEWESWLNRLVQLYRELLDAEKTYGVEAVETAKAGAAGAATAAAQEYRYISGGRVVTEQASKRSAMQEGGGGYETVLASGIPANVTAALNAQNKLPIGGNYSVLVPDVERLNALGDKGIAIV
jgi:hypothetical protein